MLLRRAWTLVAVFLAVLAVRPLTTSGATQPDIAVGLETEAADRPLGIDAAKPRLSWRLETARTAVMQSSFHVLVASRPELAREGAADVWDSGVVASPDPWVVYTGPALASARRYFWAVRVGTSRETETDWAPVTWFETALLSPGDWSAQWIAGPQRSGPLTPEQGKGDDATIRAAGEFCRPVAWLTTSWSAKLKKNNQGECRELRPAPMFRKSFQVRKPVASARLYSSGLAYAETLVNARRVSNRVLEPAFTNYAKSVAYTTDDVTALLQPGENVVAVTLGSGHYDDAARTWDWGWEEAEWRATPRLRAELRIQYEDGTTEKIASDATWKVSVDGPTRFDSYYLGETYDARREVAHWAEPGFDDAKWTPGREAEAPRGVLRAEMHEPIAIVQRREAGSRTEPKPGVIVYDVGQNLTGWAELEVSAPAGTAIEIFYSEKLNSDGTASTAGNDLVYGQLQTDYYVSSGTAIARWAPRFSYKGFQYVQVGAPGGQPLPAGVRVSVVGIDHVRTSLARTSSFGASQPTLARIHGNTRWAIESNLHGIITDTPVYEKNGWTGDAQLTAATASTMFDTERLYRKMFQDMADAQTADGELPLLSPSNRNYGYVGKPAFKPVECCGATPAWDAFWFVLPWESYVRYGDVRALERTYPLMQHYLDDWVPRWTGKDGDEYSHTLTSGLGDWLPPKDVPTLNALVSTACYARMAHIAADTARALHDGPGATKYDALFDAIRQDFNARFLGTDGVYREKPEEGVIQTAQILPLAFGLAPDAQRTAIAKRLADDVVQRRGGHAYVGVVGAAYVLPVLSAAGYHDLAVTVATKTDEPGWGFWTDTLKFTALGESWPADTRSRNHHFFGAIAQWLYEDLAGLRPRAPGFAQFEIAPRIPATGLDHVSAAYESVRGYIESSWVRTDRGLEFHLVVPPTTRARVQLPAAESSRVRGSAGGAALSPLSSVPGVEDVAAAAGGVRFELGSGDYRFLVPATPSAARNSTSAERAEAR